MTTVVIVNNDIYSDTKITTSEDVNDYLACKLFTKILRDKWLNPIIKAYLFSSRVNVTTFNAAQGKWITPTCDISIHGDKIKHIGFSGNTLIVPFLEAIVNQHPNKWLSLYNEYYYQVCDDVDGSTTLAIVGEQYNYVVLGIHGRITIYKYPKSDPIAIGSGNRNQVLLQYGEYVIDTDDAVDYITQASIVDEFTNDIIVTSRKL